MNSQQVQLLVSIRNCDEILPALQGGCDILDLKEPLNGPLAMVDKETLRGFSEFFQRQPVTVPLSMALGEMIDWQDKSISQFIPDEITYLKMGLSQTSDKANWYSHWLDLRNRIEDTHNRSYQWISVAYADWREAHAISPQAVFEAAIASHCSGLLIDTYTKQGKSLLDFLSLDQIQSLIEQARSHKIKIALAGSIHQENLGLLANTSPDIIGIRGAACLGTQRTNRLQELAVRNFRNELDNQYELTESG